MMSDTLKSAFRISVAFLMPFCICLCGGCERSASTLERHLDSLAHITMRNAAHCDLMAQKLNAYLDENGTEMKRAGHRLFMARAEDVRGIFQSTTRIDMATEHCAPPVLARFHYRMAEILFEEPQQP